MHKMCENYATIFILTSEINNKHGFLQGQRLSII